MVTNKTYQNVQGIENVYVSVSMFQHTRLKQTRASINEIVTYLDKVLIRPTYYNIVLVEVNFFCQDFPSSPVAATGHQPLTEPFSDPRRDFNENLEGCVPRVFIGQFIVDRELRETALVVLATHLC